MLAKLDRINRIFQDGPVFCLILMRIGKNISRAANPTGAMFLAAKIHLVLLLILSIF